MAQNAASGFASPASAIMLARETAIRSQQTKIAKGGAAMLPWLPGNLPVTAGRGSASMVKAENGSAPASVATPKEAQ